ncbi:MAG: uridine diphosphate-N-acetylglucosamine-binding protein YvcK [Candidatus Omnitrophica bacterium]|nr:uridine diphosphate-N-acetylglucosamine-binding protein YvcK [Candidatus Omnitrophota bacterium]
MKILLAINNEPLVALIQRALSRFSYEWVIVDNGFDAFQKAITSRYDLFLLGYELPRMNASEVLRRCCSIENFKLPPTLVLTSTEEERHRVEAEHFSQTTVVSRPIAMRKFVSIVQQSLHQNIQMTCLGGGTGLFTLLSGLKTLTGINLTSIVSMSDDGGSTGRLRDMFGILPPGDVRRSLVALSTAPDLLNELMQYRFSKGAGLEGHNLGNLLLTALHEIRGSMADAVKSLGEILNIQGNVIPVTEMVNTLHAQMDDGRVVTGEKNIGILEEGGSDYRIVKLWQEPKTSANADAIEALFNAKYIILGPGDLFTSIISNLIVDGVGEALRACPAKKIYICNVMTKPGETSGFQVSDHVKELNHYLKKDVLDYVICSSTAFSEESRLMYAQKFQHPVIEKDRSRLKAQTRAEIIFADVASETVLVRHDSLKLATVIKKIIDGSRSGALEL